MYLEVIMLCSCALMLLSIPLSFYVMFEKLDAAEHVMQYSTYIVGIRHTCRHFPFEGRHPRLYAMATVILIPGFLQRRNFVLVEDVEKIPKNLKYWMVVPSLVTFISITGMFISWLFIKD